MKWEKTKTYVKFYLGPFMVQMNWNAENKEKRRSTKTICHMIDITHKLTDDDKRQFRDYLTAVLRDEG
jgi:hypothetical protein